MPRQALKPQLCTQVRKLFSLQPLNKIHFTQEEMMEIVSQIKGIPVDQISWDGCQDFMEEELYELGWRPQETVDTHPTISNLSFLISNKAKQKRITSQIKTENNNTLFSQWAGFFEKLNLEPKEISIDKQKIVIKF